jgi:hypothetical protein
MARPFRTMLLGVSASIGILNVHQYLQLFLAEVADEIRVIMTPRAAQMMRPDLLAVISGADRTLFPSAGGGHSPAMGQQVQPISITAPPG